MFHQTIKKNRRNAFRRSGPADENQADGAGTGVKTGIAHVDQILHLQSVVGNQATQRMLGQGQPTIQRMAASGDIIGVLGVPKKDTKIGKKVIKRQATKYKAVLAEVDAYHLFMRNNVADDMGAVKNQFQQIMALLTNITGAASSYSGEKSTKGRYMTQTLPADVARERSAVSQTLMEIMLHPELLTMGAMTLQFLIAQSAQSTQPLQLLERNKTGTDAGGSNEVTRFKQGAKDGFFKENKATLADFRGKDEGEIMTGLKEKHGAEKGGQLFVAQQNETYIGIQDVGIDPNDARMAKRDVAMHRLDELLGGGVVARAELATRNTPDGKQEGSFMEAAKGKSINKLSGEGAIGTDVAGAGTVNMGDQNLMRLLSRLQLIDLLCFQVDRNMGNFYIQSDSTGKVTGITGIDNDFALGTSTGIDRKVTQLPGISRFVDAELANKILEIDVDMIAMVMEDLLSRAEIDALKTRFTKLRAALKPLKDSNQLLAPDQWTDGVAKGLLEENKSYYANVSNQMRRWGVK